MDLYRRRSSCCAAPLRESILGKAGWILSFFRWRESTNGHKSYIDQNQSWILDAAFVSSWKTEILRKGSEHLTRIKFTWSSVEFLDPSLMRCSSDSLVSSDQLHLKKEDCRDESSSRYSPEPKLSITLLLENAILHTSAQFSINFRKGRELKFAGDLQRIFGLL